MNSVPIDRGARFGRTGGPRVAAPYADVPYARAALMKVATPREYADALIREWSDGRRGWRAAALSAGVGMFFRGGFSRYLDSVRDDPEALATQLRRANLRASLASPLSDSATMMLADEPGEIDAIDRAARLVGAALDFRSELLAGRVPSRDKGHALEMGQFPNLFGTSTRVGTNGEELVRTDRPQSLAVVSSGRYFLVDLGSELDAVPLGPLRASLREIVRLTRGPTPSVTAGTVSAAGGDTRTNAFRELDRSETCRASLAALARAVFVLCLDTDGPVGDAGSWFHARNVANRWYNASLQLVVGRDASAAVILNYRCYLDGNVMTTFGESVWNRARQLNIDVLDEVASATRCELQWELPPTLLEACARSFAPIVASGPTTIQIEGIGRDAMAVGGLSPDAVFTHALMLAAHRLTDRVPRVTQYLAMNRFRSMGITTAMVTTPSAARAVEAVRFRRGVDDVRQHVLHATREHAATQRASRSVAPLGALLRLYLARSSRAAAAFRLLGALAPPIEIQISHPRLRPGVTRIGRPGVARRAIREFAGHYSIDSDRTELIVMPSQAMPYSVDDLGAALRGALCDWLSSTSTRVASRHARAR